jgi:hypothetical protein
MVNAKDLTPLVEELCESLQYNNEKLIDALHWIGEEASPSSIGLNLTDALAGIARGLFAVAEAIEKKQPVTTAAAQKRPGDWEGGR